MGSWCNQTFRWTQMFQYRWDLLIIVKQVKIPVTKWQSLVALCRLGLQKYALFQMSTDLFQCWLSQQLVYLILVLFYLFVFLHNYRKAHICSTFGTVNKATEKQYFTLIRSVFIGDWKLLGQTFLILKLTLLTNKRRKRGSDYAPVPVEQ